MRWFLAAGAVGALAVGLAVAGAQTPEEAGADGDQLTLMGSMQEWTYPGATMSGGARMSDGGNRTLQSVRCEAVFVTADPIERVIEHYAKTFTSGPAAPPAAAEGAGDWSLTGIPQSVSMQDDSAKRPLTLRVVTIQRANTSTTLVVSRAEGESETHIAWSHYAEFAAGH